MKTIRVYTDTSALGGCFDPEFAPWSNGLVDDFRQGRIRLVLSDVIAAELAGAPEAVRELEVDLRANGAEVIAVTGESLALLAAYQAHHILGDRFKNDMLHIALATVAEVDVLVSWNFRHIVRLDKIRVFNAVNAELGYRAITICSPREVTSYGQSDDDSGG
jgi:hypothetical protein